MACRWLLKSCATPPPAGPRHSSSWIEKLLLQLLFICCFKRIDNHCLIVALACAGGHKEEARGAPASPARATSTGSFPLPRARIVESGLDLRAVGGRDEACEIARSCGLLRGRKPANRALVLSMVPERLSVAMAKGDVLNRRAKRTSASRRPSAPPPPPSGSAPMCAKHRPCRQPRKPRDAGAAREASGRPCASDRDRSIRCALHRAGPDMREKRLAAGSHDVTDLEIAIGNLGEVVIEPVGQCRIEIEDAPLGRAEKKPAGALSR